MNGNGERKRKAEDLTEDRTAKQTKHGHDVEIDATHQSPGSDATALDTTPPHLLSRPTPAAPPRHVDFSAHQPAVNKDDVTLPSTHHPASDTVVPARVDQGEENDKDAPKAQDESAPGAASGSEYEESASSEASESSDEEPASNGASESDGEPASSAASESGDEGPTSNEASEPDGEAPASDGTPGPDDEESASKEASEPADEDDDSDDSPPHIGGPPLLPMDSGISHIEVPEGFIPIEGYNDILWPTQKKRHRAILDIAEETKLGADLTTKDIIRLANLHPDMPANLHDLPTTMLEALRDQARAAKGVRSRMFAAQRQVAQDKTGSEDGKLGTKHHVEAVFVLRIASGQ